MELTAPSLTDLIAPAYYEPWNDGVTGAATELWMPGGRYSGKSTYIARAIMAMMSGKGFEECHCAAFRKHQVDLRESVYTEFELAAQALGVSYLWDFKSSPLRMIRKDTGQTITFNGLDDPRKHKSKKPPFGYVRFLWFEELDEFACWDDIESVQISYQRGAGPFQSFCSFNPPRSSANWANAECARHLKGRKVYHTDYRDLEEMGWISPQVLERIEQCRLTRPEVYRHVYLGEATGTGGEIFTNVKDATFTDEQVKEFRRLGSYGEDFGIVSDPTVLEGTYYDRDKDYLYIFEESVLMHPFFTTVYNDLKNRGLDRFPIIADTAPAGWIQNINMLGANLHGCFKSEDWPETGVSWMRDRTKIIIDSERCPLAWDEFVHYEYDTYANGKPKEKLPDRQNHAIDACLRCDTLVQTDRGNIRIDELVGKEGKLWSYDEATGKKVLVDFCNCSKTRRDAELIRIELEDRRFVDCTPDHRILTSNRGWVMAQDLTENDDVVEV